MLVELTTERRLNENCAVVENLSFRLEDSRPGLELQAGRFYDEFNVKLRVSTGKNR